MDAPLQILSILLGGVLVVLSAIDIRTRRLPDWLTVPLIGTGLAVGGLESTTALSINAIGAAIGFTALWLVAYVYRSLRSADGLGLGDAKLMAAAGAWLGPLYLAPIVFVGGLLAILSALLLRVAGTKLSWRSSLPFGPFLSVGFFGFWCLKLAGWSPF
jgi:leader peptidase (prepilin peptidase)/N-methyltransferase